MVKKYHFDLLIVKNVNKTVCLRVVLYIQEFEVDIAQKSKDKNVKKNVNSHKNTCALLKDFYFKYTTVKDFFKINQHRIMLKNILNFKIYML